MKNYGIYLVNHAGNCSWTRQGLTMNLNHLYLENGWIQEKKVKVLSKPLLCPKLGGVIIKPVDSCMGIGIRKINGNNEEDLINFLKEVRNGKHYIIEEILENHPDVKRINPPSLNTIRVVTCLDSKHEIHILATCLRAGISEAITDNVCTGGIVCHIDEKYGIIDTKAYNHLGASYSVHPNSGVFMIGYEISQWDNVIEFLPTEPLLKVCIVIKN